MAACVHNRYLLVTLKHCLLSDNWPGNPVANANTHHVEQTQAVLKHILGALMYMANAMTQRCPSHVGTKQVQDALKGGKGGGSYFPLIAAQVQSSL